MRKIDKIKAEKEIYELFSKYIENDSCLDLWTLQNGTWLEAAYDRHYYLPLLVIKTTSYTAHFIKITLKKYLKTY